MNDPAALAGMLPFDSIGLYEQPKPRFIFKMPRVVPDQKSKFESDELFRRLSRESEVSHVCCVTSAAILCRFAKKYLNIHTRTIYPCLRKSVKKNMR
jgi:hypothetical protein